MSAHHKVVIIGGGTGGIFVAARLARLSSHLEIVVIEPSQRHFYQPLWTLVGAGAVRAEQTVREEKKYIPSGVKWVQEAATKVLPNENQVLTEGGQKLEYDYLVVAPGIQINLGVIPGLKETMGKNGVGSVYLFDQAPKVWEMLKEFRGGRALFTQPSTPYKCPGASQKIMYLAEDYFQKKGIREKAQIFYNTPRDYIFGIKAFAPALLKVIQRKKIHVNYSHELVRVDGERRQAHFQVKGPDGAIQIEIKDYDFLHVTPPMSAPDFIQESPLSIQEGPLKGWLEVDPFTLQHKRYPNVFGIGDVAGIGASKTGAAARKQAPVVVNNLWQTMQGKLSKETQKKYQGYASCPLITGYGKVIMAEFDYSGEPTPTFPLDPLKERYSMWLLKRYALPWLYWHAMLRGWA